MKLWELKSKIKQIELNENIVIDNYDIKINSKGIINREKDIDIIDVESNCIVLR